MKIHAGPFKEVMRNSGYWRGSPDRIAASDFSWSEDNVLTSTSPPVLAVWAETDPATKEAATANVKNKGLIFLFLSRRANPDAFVVLVLLMWGNKAVFEDTNCTRPLTWI